MILHAAMVADRVILYMNYHRLRCLAGLLDGILELPGAVKTCSGKWTSEIMSSFSA